MCTLPNNNFTYEFMYITNGAIRPEIYFKDITKNESEYHTLKDCDDQDIMNFIDHLRHFPEARTALLFLNQVPRLKGDYREILKQFIKCNFAPLNTEVDMLPNKLNYEYVQCQYRGKCPLVSMGKSGEGLVCIKCKPN